MMEIGTRMGGSLCERERRATWGNEYGERQKKIKGHLRVSMEIKYSRLFLKYVCIRR